jgi:dipeptidyl aminopeptidase/acylaminoacyl peptidase
VNQKERLLLILVFALSLAAAISAWLGLHDHQLAFSIVATVLALLAGVSAVYLLQRRQRRSPGGTPTFNWKRIFGFAIIVILLTLVVGANWLARDRARAIIHPTRFLPSSTPEQFDIQDYQNVTFSSLDGLNLRGWYMPPKNGAVVIVLHGHGGNRDQLLLDTSFLIKQGFGALLYDARNCGESDGEMTTLGLKEIDDVRGALAFVQAQPGVDPKRIGIMGHSMGGATGIMAAAQTQDFRAVVSESAFSSLESLIRGNIQQLLGLPAFPFAPLTIFWGQVETGVDIQGVKPVLEINAISPRPILLIHGGLDDTIPVENAYQLYEAAREPKELWIIAGAYHCCLPQVGGEEYSRRIVEFFSQNLLKP